MDNFMPVFFVIAFLSFLSFVGLLCYGSYKENEQILECYKMSVNRTAIEAKLLCHKL